MKVIHKNPGEAPEVIEMGSTLRDLQDKVHGLIELVRLNDDNCYLICNEEGKLMGMRENFPLGYDIIAGPILIVGIDDDTGDFISTPDIEYWMSWLKKIAG